MFRLTRTSDLKPGGLVELLKLALPAGISQACFSLMMFTDRLLLTPLGKEAPAASMLAGFSSFLLAVFFFGLLNYITPLVAQYLGSEQKDKLSKVLHQGIILTVCAYPFLVSLGQWGIGYYFDWTGIHESQKVLAMKYFTIINTCTIFSLFNIAMSSFFSGLGKTYIVMVVNTLGMLVNLPVSYILIKYGIGGYWKGIQGAALGSSISVAFMSLLFTLAFLSPKMKKAYKTNLKLKWDDEIMGKLVKFGSPSGVEMLLTFVAFSTFVALFHSYGVNEALSATIVFNWDIVAFLPVWGISIGLMSLVGKYMGAHKIQDAITSIKSGAIASFLTMAFASLAFFTMTELLISVFLPDTSEATYNEIMPLASTMLKLVSLYCFAIASNLVMSAALRAAGDTKSVMYIAITGQWFMLILAYCAIRVWNWEPILTWTIFVCSLFFETVLYAFRFFQGSWKKIRVV